jgi:hypothetical protein
MAIGTPSSEPRLIKRGSGVSKIYNSNPFMPEVETKNRRVSRGGSKNPMVMVSSEVDAQAAGFWETQEVDATQFVKLFVSGVKALKELSSSGSRVFEVLYLRVQSEIGKDLVNMGFWLVDQKTTPMSEKTYIRGLGELIAKEFIALTPNAGLYWLNPSFVWNGDRLAFVKEYRRKPAISIKTDQPPLFPEFSEDAF